MNGRLRELQAEDQFYFLLLKLCSNIMGCEIVRRPATKNREERVLMMRGKGVGAASCATQSEPETGSKAGRAPWQRCTVAAARPPQLACTLAACSGSARRPVKTICHLIVILLLESTVQSQDSGGCLADGASIFTNVSNY